MLCLFYSRSVFISHLHVRLSQETIQLSGLFRGAGQWPDVNQQLQRQNKKKFLHVQKHKTATEMRRKHFFKSGNQSGTWNVSPEAKSRNGAGESLRYCPRHSYTWKHQVSQTLWIPHAIPHECVGCDPYGVQQNGCDLTSLDWVCVLHIIMLYCVWFVNLCPRWVHMKLCC